MKLNILSRPLPWLSEKILKPVVAPVGEFGGSGPVVIVEDQRGRPWVDNGLASAGVAVIVFVGSAKGDVVGGVMHEVRFCTSL